MRLRPGLCRGPHWGNLQHSPDPLAGLWGLLRGMGGREGRREMKGQRRGAFPCFFFLQLNHWSVLCTWQVILWRRTWSRSWDLKAASSVTLVCCLVTSASPLTKPSWLHGAATLRPCFALSCQTTDVSRLLTGSCASFLHVLSITGTVEWIPSVTCVHLGWIFVRFYVFVLHSLVALVMLPFCIFVLFLFLYIVINTCHPNCFILHLLSATTEDTSI